MKAPMLHEKMTPALRVKLAEQMARGYSSRELSPGDRKIAIQLFHLLAEDVEVQVRRTLAEQLQHDSELPKTVAKKLARDVNNAVSTPILRHSQVLDDHDLIEIIQATENATSLLAIASRDTVSGAVGEQLAGKGKFQVVQRLCENPGASLNEQVAMKVADVFGADASLLAQFIQRASLPLDVAEKMVLRVSEGVRKELASRYDISSRKTLQMTEQAREQTIIDMLQPGGQSVREMQQFVAHLKQEGRLNASLLIRALCVGNLNFFECAMARMADISLENTRKLMQDRGNLGFRALFKAAGLPSSMYDAIHTILRFAMEETHNGKLQTADYRQRMMQRIMSEGHDRKVANMDFMLAILNQRLPQSLSL